MGSTCPVGRWSCFFFFQAEDGIRDSSVTGVQTCALPICARIGFAVVPRDLIDVFTGAKFATDRQPATLLQTMVTDFMRQGFLNGHIRRMRQLYREARDVVVEGIRRHMGYLVDVEVPESGIQR